MDTKRQRVKKDMRDMPICKPSDPLPQIFNTVPHSGFTTTSRRSVRANEAARDMRAAARPRSEN